MPLADQITVFAWTLAIGMLAGLCYEIYRAVSDTLRLRRVGTFTADLIFWLFLTALAFFLLVKANYGQLRLYVFIGLLLGAFLFVRFLGDIAYTVVRWFFRLAGRMLRLVTLLLYYLWKAVSFPFRIIIITVVFPVRVAGVGLGRAGRSAGRLAGRPVGSLKGRIRLAAEKILKKITPPG